MKVLTYVRAQGGFVFLDDTVVTLFLKESVRGGSLLPCASTDNDRLVKHPITGRAAAYRVVQALAYVPPVSGAASGTSTNRGAVLTWPAAGSGQYHVERSTDSANGYPALSYYRLTAGAINVLTFKDLFALAGETHRYRIYTVSGTGAISLHVELTVTQISYGTGDAAMTITNAGYSPTGVNVISGKVIYTTTGSVAFDLKSDYEFEFRDNIVIGPGGFMRATTGTPKITLRNNLAIGTKPPAGNANKSVGNFLNASYSKYIALINNTVREMGGAYIGNYRGSDTTKPILMTGNLFWNLNRKRVDAAGAYIKSAWSSYVEDSGNKGFTKPSLAGGVTEPIGWDICNAYQINNDGAFNDGLTTVGCVGGADVLGNLCVGQPGVSLMEDATSLYLAGGESVAKPWRIRAWCTFNNPSHDFNHTGSNPWNMGLIKTNGTGSGPPAPSQTGGLQSDHSPDTPLYNLIGSYTTNEDSWYIGLGVRLSVQAGHHHQLIRPTVLGSTLSPDGTTYTAITGGDTRSNPAISRYDSRNASDTGQPLFGPVSLVGYRGIVPDCYDIGTRNLQTHTYPWGIDDAVIDLANSSDNIAVKRNATVTEMWQGYYDFLAKCASFGVTRLGCVPA